MSRRPVIAATVVAALLTSPVMALGHSPDPIVGGALWSQDQDVLFGWRAGSISPPRMREAILAAAVDSNDSRGSRAAVFRPHSEGASRIGYGVDATCGINGIACFDRSGAPDSFVMWFREQGHVFDWGTLKWCQMYDSPPNGCYDAENVAIDEFGHVEILGHHDNYADDADYLDAVVQTFSRTKPKAGWNEHDYGRCDVATLQLRYDVPGWTAKYSTCLSLQTSLGLVPSATSIPHGTSVTFTATLKVGPSDAYLKLKSNPISGRSVVLQRRPVGGTSWTAIATMAQSSTAGVYRWTVAPATSYEWRVVFSKPPGEGLQASISPIVTVSVPSCPRPPCPVSASAATPAGGTMP
jgi:hypothetical protein